jgi:hypothetical protein
MNLFTLAIRKSSVAEGRRCQRNWQLSPLFGFLGAFI